MTRLLIEECRYKEKLTERYKDPTELKTALSHMNFKVIRGTHPPFNASNDLGETVSEHLRDTFSKSISRFIDNEEKYLSALEYFSQEDMDYNVREHFKKIESHLNINDKSHTDQEIRDLNDPFFYKNIVIPFLQCYSLFLSLIHI